MFITKETKFKLKTTSYEKTSLHYAFENENISVEIEYLMGNGSKSKIEE